jgi:hypothetical protein
MAKGLPIGRRNEKGRSSSERCDLGKHGDNHFIPARADRCRNAGRRVLPVLFGERFDQPAEPSHISEAHDFRSGIAAL